jgi:hypothetical protein
MKGEAYRRYYEANKEYILEANRARAKERREKLDTLSEEDREILREKHREKIEKRRLAYYRVALDELATLHKDDDFGSLYKTLSESPCIKELSPSMFRWLVSVSRTDK